MKILIAVDGSPTALKAAQTAVAKFSHTATYTLINVQADEHLRSLQGRIGKATVDEYLRERHEEDLKEVSAWLAGQNIKFDTIVAEGRLASTIAAHAADGGYDLIVIGSKGRGSLADVMVGSTVTRLIAISRVPVLVVPAAS